MPRQILVNAFDMNCVTHLVAGTWRAPRDRRPRATRTSPTGRDLAQSCSSAASSTGSSSPTCSASTTSTAAVHDAALRGGRPGAGQRPAAGRAGDGGGHRAPRLRDHRLDLLRAPVHLRPPDVDARPPDQGPGRLEHRHLLSGERRPQPSASTPQVRHDDRYDIADEYMEVLYKLWEGSWEDDAVVERPRARRSTPTPRRCTRSSTRGSTSRCPASTSASPRRSARRCSTRRARPSAASTFAAEHAEAVFIGAPTDEILRDSVADIRGRAVAAGRDPYDIKVVSGYVGGRRRRPRPRRRRSTTTTVSLVDPEGTLALWSGWLGFDLSRFELDEPVRHVPQRVAASRPTRPSATASGRCATSSTRTVSAPTGRPRSASPTSVADDRSRGSTRPTSTGFNLTHVDHAGDLRRLRRPRRPRAAAARPLQDLLRRRHPAREVVRPRPAPARDPPGGALPPRHRQEVTR